jgi:hypothetical protein
MSETRQLGKYWLDLDLWLKLWLASQRIVVAIIVLGGHYAFRKSVEFLFGEEFKQIQQMYSITGQVALYSLDAWLLIEALRIFLPPPLGIKLNLTPTPSGVNA